MAKHNPPVLHSVPDQHFFAIMECMDAYLAAQEDLAAALKDGLFDIAKGKYALGPGSLGQQRYPGDMQAAATVQLQQPHDQPDCIFEHFQLLLQQQQQQCGSEAQQQAAAGQSKQQPGAAELRQRRKQDQQDTSSTQQQSADADAPLSSSSNNGSSSSSVEQGQHAVDPVAWFSALPPAPLKSAQARFKTALQQAVAAANLVQQLRHLLEQLPQADQAAAAAPPAAAASIAAER